MTRGRKRWVLGVLILLVLVGVVLVAVAVGGGAEPGTGYEDDVLAAEPAGYWRLGETSGDEARDLTGDVPGFYAGSVGHGVAGAISGDTDTAAAFNGLSSQVRLRDGFDYAGTQPFTLEAWVKPTIEPGDFSRIFSHEEDRGGARQGYAVWVDGSAGLGFERYGDGETQGISYDEGLPVGKYSLVNVTFEPRRGETRRMRIFVNGRTVASADFDQPVELEDIDMPLFLGRQSDQPAAYFEGVLDEVAIYDSALTATEVEERYDAAR